MSVLTILKNGAVITVALLLTLPACKRDKTNSTPALTTSDDNGGYASDAARLESTSDDVISIADVAAAGQGSTLRTTSVCATVTNDTTSTPRLLTINFGTSDCLCADGKYRRGEILVAYSGQYKDSGSVHTITYNGYYVNDNLVTGSKTVTNEGANSSGQVWYSVVLNDSITLAGTDSIIHWTADRTRTWVNGYGTATKTDDVYSIADATGASGTVLTRANGHVFTFTITSPLIVADSCEFIEGGILQISSSTFSTDRILNYGYTHGAPNSCDDLAQLTIGSYTYVITLH